MKAFGHKKAEGKLQGLVTEESVMIEPKFFNAAMAKNRLSMVIAANNEWIVPASPDERRYAPFNVANTYAVGQASEEVRVAYFEALRREMYEAEGIEAFMDDLLNVELGAWHPRKDIPDTDALHEQKELSLRPLDKYFVHLLESSYLPNNRLNEPNEVSSVALLKDAALNVPGGRYEFENGKLGKYLRAKGCIQSKHVKELVPGKYEDEVKRTSGWGFPPLDKARAAWTKIFPGQKWATEAEEWSNAHAEPESKPKP